MGIVVTSGVQYDIVDIDLADENTDEMLALVGRSISILHRTGDLEIRFNHLRNPKIDISQINHITAEKEFFTSVFFTNTAQAGCVVRLLVARMAGITSQITWMYTNQQWIGGVEQSGKDLTPYIALPTAVVAGAKTDITTTAAPLTAASAPIKKGVVLQLFSLGGGSYVALGHATMQPYVMTVLGDTLVIDWTDDLHNVYVITDAGNTGDVRWIGG